MSGEYTVRLIRVRLFSLVSYLKLWSSLRLERRFSQARVSMLRKAMRAYELID